MRKLSEAQNECNKFPSFLCLCLVVCECVSRQIETNIHFDTNLLILFADEFSGYWFWRSMADDNTMKMHLAHDAISGC